MVGMQMEIDFECMKVSTKLLVWICCKFLYSCASNKTLQSYYMINNYLQHQYHPWDRVYSHESLGGSIYLGDISAALDLDFIRREQIRTVITAAVGMDHVQYDSSISHIVYPLLDMKSENISKYFSQFVELVERELAKGSILVHCAAGISRSSTLVIAYLMKRKSCGFKEAISFVRQARPNVCPNLGFQRQLKEYELFLNKQAEFGFQRRFGSKTSEERKHVASPNKQKVLPQIVMMGRTQLKPKLLDLFAIQPPQQRFSQQRSRNPNQYGREKEDLEFYGTKRITFKPKKSKSIQEKADRPLNLSPLFSDESKKIQRLKASLPLQHLDQMSGQRVNINNPKKIATQRQIRVKPLHKLAFY